MISKSGRVVIITGATGNIGSKITKEFSRDGWNIAVAYHKNKCKAMELVEEIIHDGHSDAAAWNIDLSDIRMLESMVNGIIQRWKRIDVLINNASISRDGLVLKMSLDDWEKVLTVNLTGSFNLLRMTSRIMMKQRDGHIINIASLLGLKGSIGASNYAASKAALISLSQSAAKELGRFNVRVNAVLPGFHKSSINENADKKIIEQAKNDSLLHCTTDPRELAEFILFISKTKSITGQIFNCDSRVL
ncbi:MAG: SDR family NAD(P)-dependent oxidoreductase [bacterium]